MTIKSSPYDPAATDKPRTTLAELQAAMRWWNTLSLAERGVMCDKHPRQLRSAAEVARFWVANIRDTMNDSIRQMLTKPGIYVLADTAMPKAYALAEVDAEGTVHQLTPQGQRDGILVADGWKATAVAHGPFVTLKDAHQFTWEAP